MEQNRKKYILLQDRIGSKIERGFINDSRTDIQALKGEVFEALPEAQQPSNSQLIALAAIERTEVHLECSTSDLARLSDKEADLLMAVTSARDRHTIYHDRNRLDAGKQLKESSKVWVKVKGVSKELRGVVWYSGPLETCNGTMFGVELVETGQGQGTTDGMFRNKRYFLCPPDSGVFVSLDKLTPREDEIKGTFTTLKEKITECTPAVIRSRTAGKEKKHKGELDCSSLFKLDQKVFVFLQDGKQVKGSVRYFGGEKDVKGRWYILVGVELVERLGNGTGMFKGKQLFTCRNGFAIFASADNVIPVDQMMDDSQGRRQKGIGNKVRTQEDLPQYGTRYQEKLRAEADRGPKSLSYIETNRREPRGTQHSYPLRRSSSSASSTEDLDVIKSAHLGIHADGSNKDEILDEQRRILDKIQKEKWQDIGKDDVPTHSELSNMHEFHFGNGKPITTQPGRSKFYIDDSGGDYVELRQDETVNDSQALATSGADHTSNSTCSATTLCITRGMTNSYQTSAVTISSPQSLPGKDVLLIKPVPRTNVEKELEVDSANSDRFTEEGKCVAHFAESTPFPGHDPSHAVAHDLPEAAADQNKEVEFFKPDLAALEAARRLGLEIGSMVEIPLIDGQLPRYGVIRWIGFLPELQGKLVAGVELEVEQSACSDGSFSGKRYFTCPPGRGFFVLLQNCRQDSRFTPDSPLRTTLHPDKAFGTTPSPVVEEDVPPPHDLSDDMCGDMRGIQGHHNSCYLDATLFSMFSFSLVFDTLLHRERHEGDLREYDEVQKVLKDKIVNPLRKNGYVRADRVLQLRRLLDQLGTTSGLVNEEKDPEEFLNTLFHQVFKVEPYLQLRSQNRTEGAHFYQLIIEKDDTIKVPTIQQLLRRSFFSADIKLAEVPSCLILFMPRFGNKYKMYDMVLPNLTLDITDIVESVPSICYHCGMEPGRYECKECLLEENKGGVLCENCNSPWHKHPDRVKHEFKPIPLPRNHPSGDEFLRKHEVQLFAVVSIETSHYVSFVKCGEASDSSWCFFDSMADRKGEQNGYNIPSVTPCPEAAKWLSKVPRNIIGANERGEIPQKVRRLLSDAYLCMYQNTEMMMYK